MKCYVNNLVTDIGVDVDVKTLIPNASIRRRLNGLVRKGVATAMCCIKDIDASSLDAIITATGWGCLAESEQFLSNVISNGEQSLNPTPFIQSTFNTVGGYVALLTNNHCYNVTYVNRSHSFEDALLDSMLRLSEKEANSVLLGAFDEETDTQKTIMGRMGLFRSLKSGEGCVFTHLTSYQTDRSIAYVSDVDFSCCCLSEKECMDRYSSSSNTKLLYNEYKKYGLYPTVSARLFADGVNLVYGGMDEVVIYNEYLGGKPVVIVVRCIGS